jgi:hypothetical protein
MDAGEDYGKMFIVKDKLCDGTKWHIRTNPAIPRSIRTFPLIRLPSRLRATVETYREIEDVHAELQGV